MKTSFICSILTSLLVLNGVACSRQSDQDGDGTPAQRQGSGGNSANSTAAVHSEQGATQNQQKTGTTATATPMNKTVSDGGWNGGGGFLPNDSVNPWFISNTSEVNYCILIDEENFGQTKAIVSEKITAAFDYWRKDFAFGVKSIEIYETHEKFSIATQKFNETDCNAKTDIVFQMGVLSKEQIKRYVPAPELTVGVAIRTDYDRVNLKGKGFVYISPELGENALNATTSFGPVVDKRWSFAEGKLLEVVLVHELGHVFGVPHNLGGLMHESVPDVTISQLVNWGDWSKPENFSLIPVHKISNLKENTFRMKGKSDLEKAVGYLRLKDLPTELSIGFDKNEGKLFVYSNSGMSTKKIAQLIDTHHGYAAYKNQNVLYLSSLQKVFHFQPAKLGTVISFSVPDFSQSTFKIQPISDEIAAKHISLKVMTDEMRLTTTHADGSIIVSALEFNTDFGSLYTSGNTLQK